MSTLRDGMFNFTVYGFHGTRYTYLCTVVNRGQRGATDQKPRNVPFSIGTIVQRTQVPFCLGFGQDVDVCTKHGLKGSS